MSKRSASALRACPGAGTLFGRPLARRRRLGPRRSAGAIADVHRGRRHRPLFQGVDGGPGDDPGGSGGSAQPYPRGKCRPGGRGAPPSPGRPRSRGCRRIRPSDRARIVRALEVFEATGRSLAAWRNAGKAADRCRGDERMVLDVDRKLLHQRIAERASRMVAGRRARRGKSGRGVEPRQDLPARKAIGLSELIDHSPAAPRSTRRLPASAPRPAAMPSVQMTWFRHQMSDWGSVSSR